MKKSLLILFLVCIFGLVGCRNGIEFSKKNEVSKEVKISKYDEDTILKINEFYNSMTTLKSDVASCKSFSEMRSLLEDKKELFDNFSAIEIREDSDAGQCVKAIISSYDYKLFQSDYITAKVLGNIKDDVMDKELLLQGFSDVITVVTDKILMLIPSDLILESDVNDKSKEPTNELEVTKEDSAQIEKEVVGDPQDSVADKFEKISVTIIDKKNYEIDYDAGRYSPFVEMPYSITNNTDKEIKGIQGTLCVQDMFGEEIMEIQYDLTSQNVPVGQTVNIYEYGMEVNQFKAEHVKLYDTSYENLKFEYEFISVVFADGTSIK